MKNVQNKTVRNKASSTPRGVFMTEIGKFSIKMHSGPIYRSPEPKLSLAPAGCVPFGIRCRFRSII